MDEVCFTGAIQMRFSVRSSVCSFDLTKARIVENLYGAVSNV